MVLREQSNDAFLRQRIRKALLRLRPLRYVREIFEFQVFFSTFSGTLTLATYLNDVFEFFETRPHIRNLPGKRTVPSPIQKGFELRNGYFPYVGSGKPALRDLPA